MIHVFIAPYIKNVFTAWYMIPNEIMIKPNVIIREKPIMPDRLGSDCTYITNAPATGRSARPTINSIIPLIIDFILPLSPHYLYMSRYLKMFALLHANIKHRKVYKPTDLYYIW